ncbi:hypothetical protein [Halopseudomonas pelagia]|uniref:DUF4375 domain-containing protein n=1 Tax=Halopseudomonas pelagia TaxID=553151 RepID=A0AA91Z490_9GAMM|nr:hypothetical protein [Halopseudomonas pelagia]PCC97320.1 hypothetical protein CO192_21355 [Halopseudomonas pelagia]QFY58522.1 hypothetical protein EAO82_20485 [Halopseudomonas pelagia]
MSTKIALQGEANDEIGSDSPFLKYRSILVNEGYSSARSLQDFALSCYNGSLGQFQGSSIRNFDSNHFEIFLELVNSYYHQGESDPHLLTVGAAIWANRLERGRKLLAEIARHRAIKPSDYEDGDESEYRQQMDWLERECEMMRAKGWID